MSWDSPPLTLKRRRTGVPAIAYRLLRPAGEPKVAVLVTFGYFENLRRYREVAERWNELGVLVALYDLRGHGASEGKRGVIVRFDEYVDDALSLLSELDEDAAWKKLGPPVLFGHSLGGLVSIHTALRAQDRFAGLALSSPYLALAKEVPAAKLTAGRLLSRLAPIISLPSGLTGADCTRSTAIGEAYDRDPMNFKNANVRWFTETLAAQKRALDEAPGLRLPIFCLQGGDDKIALADATDRFMERVGSARRAYRRLPGVYHEILNEPERAGWIDEYARAMKGFLSPEGAADTGGAA